MKVFKIFVCLVVTSLSLSINESHALDQNMARYGELPQIQRMTIAPSGKKVAYRQVTQELDVVIITEVETKKTLAAIDVSSIDPGYVNFINEDTLLMSVSKHVDSPDFGAYELSTAMAYDLKKGKLRQLLTPGKDDVYAGQSGMGHIVGVSDDGKSVFMPAYSGKPSYVDGKQLSPPMALFKVKLSSGKARISKRGRDSTIDYFVDHKGDVIARETYDEKDNLHRVFAYQEKKQIEIFAEQTPYRVKSFIGVSLDEQYLFFSSANNETGRIALYKVSLADGAIQGPLYDREDADVARVITDFQRRVLGVEYSGFLPSYLFFDNELNARVQSILNEFSMHSVHIADISPNLEHILVQVAGSQLTGDYFLFTKGIKPSFLASNRPNIPTQEINPIGQAEFKARDGLTIPTLLTIPWNRIDSMKNLPAVVMPHGGPASHDQIGFDYLAQALAAQGYLVIHPQFRGSSGFGAKHTLAGYGEWGRKMQHDLTDAVGYFAEKGLIDKNRVCIVGASYGGYAALAGGAFTPDLYKCVVATNGIGNLKTFRRWVKEERGNASESLAYWEAQIRGFDEEDKLDEQRSPQFFAKNFKTPVLLIHSENDQIVPPRQSELMARALKKADKSVESVELKNGDHNISKQQNRMEEVRKTVEFVKRHI